MGHPDVAPLYEMDKSLAWEQDKFQGFVRFEEHGGMLCGVIHPRTTSSPFAGAFLRPLPGRGFLIYDAVHLSVLLWQDHKAQILQLAEPLELPPPNAQEQLLQRMWEAVL